MRRTGVGQIGYEPQSSAVPRELREFLVSLSSKGHMVHVKHAVSLESGFRPYSNVGSERGDTFSILFDNLTGSKRRRLVLNLLGSWRNCALACGLSANSSLEEVIKTLCCRAEKHEDRPIQVSNAPFYQCVQTDHINLFHLLPLFPMSDSDCGCYLHKACIASQESAPHHRSCSSSFGMYSLQVQGPDKLGVHLRKTDDLGIHLGMAEQLDRPLAVAICLGVPPLATIIAAAGVGHATEEYNLISSLQEMPFEITRCLNSELYVPARSEVVLEGFIQPNSHCAEGPFVFDRGTLTSVSDQPQITITSVAYREDPIVDNIYFGNRWTERDCLAGMASVLRLHRNWNDILTQVVSSGACAERAYLRLEYLVS